MLQNKLFMLCVILLFTQKINAKNNNLNVFYDCSNYGGNCFFDYVRQENSLINFVRDRMDADVHILLKGNWNSIGTQTVTYTIIGKNNFASLQDTMNFTIPLNSTEDESRKIMVKQLQIALLPYIAKTNLPDNISFNFKKANETETNNNTTTNKQNDPYNNWVFQMGVNGSVSGSQIYKDANFSSWLSADRETDTTKTNIYVSFNEQKSSYNDNGNISIYEFQSYSFGADYIKKLNEHLGEGITIGFNNSLYSNLKSQLFYGPKIEFSIFPYKIFNSKRWVINYGINAKGNIYYDTTVYFKTTENYFTQNINTIFSYTQPWGSINAGVFYSNLLNDFKKNNLSFQGAISTRLAKGLNFAIWGNYNFVHNQINIRKGDATLGQILVKNRELLSAYDFSGGIGITYRFGSKFNDAVNPAFKGMSYSINL